ncbi:hypothetical protein [Actimicrobium sp. CCI2.3]|uniref:hypothetical protein n=1 Tax=Actimicrobium sp. CCI2.3 TaxID=3048616 RepID=UPI002AB586BF|nr:hypothetical protein [Actimicrobium sp. CCI2.3]MDY7574520.1 hypothetical protein [Actimicrobium sp. CCI2.3]MEB0024082.1 hypothetical protein [Actimicrobium sp. CCI2.3]
MPLEIRHIDAIGRQKGRDVLYIAFHDDLRQRLDWEALDVRRGIIVWLDANTIGWEPCGHVGSTTFFGRYLGQIYIDLPYEENDPVYLRLAAFLEKPDGSSALPGARFCYYPLSEAMENAHHDVPGFWDTIWDEL